MRTSAVLLGILGTGLFLAGSLTQAEDWPGWRGPTGQGISKQKGLPIQWGGKEHRNIRWQSILPGVRDKAKQDQNQSSPVVSRGHVFITASYWPDGVDQKQFPEHHVVCYRVRDGEQLWDSEVEHGPWSRASDLRGGYTAPTPASDRERVYVLFGSSVLAALDFQGKQLWRKEITPYKFDVAIGTSPVLYKDTVLVQCDQSDRSSRLLAFDGKTGELKWEKKRPNVNWSHSTPVLAEVNGQTQLLTAASNALQGIDPNNGEVLWWCATRGDTVSPVLGDGVVYLDSGRGGPAVAVDPTGSGDVTATHRKWQLKHVSEGFSSPVIAGGYLYRLTNPETLRCWKIADGKQVFAERLRGVSTASSPFTTPEGRIYFASAGKSYVVKAGAKLDVLAVNDLEDRSQASPAVANGYIFLKGRKYLYCIGDK
ncbi:MAG TPA: PQQ-binding-like beta-propeller repeat protein [Gemmataceae bacterium]|nr:PQQ-binding-like beta-propeller repeat protein [Gemmataceae bacterium]